MSDNEDATAPLRNSKVLCVQNCVGEPIPEFCHAPEYGTKVPSSVRGQDAGDILPNQPSGPCAVSKPKIFEGQVATVIIQPASKSSDRERLAGGSSDKKVNWAIFIASDRGEIPVQGHIGIVVFQNGAGERLDLAERSGFPAKRVPSDGRGLDAGADA
jgi:hypothetical protein